jgi:superfamily II DNA or RNA helicase
MDILNLYDKYICDIYTSLKNSDKTEYINNDLWKIFEYYSCIQLSKSKSDVFRAYDDIDPVFKELHNLSLSDTGVDASNLTDTIVQCKLRKKSLTWKECATFFGNNITIKDDALSIKWNRMIITRNDDIKLSRNLLQKQSLYEDIAYSKDEMLKYCEELLVKYSVQAQLHKQVDSVAPIRLVLRDYQVECVDLIKNNDKNIIISLPTGTGKNVIIINAIELNKKYLIVVPRIFLLSQIKNELIAHNPTWNRSIQTIGDGNTTYNDKYNITICVSNSIECVTNFDQFHKIFIDEAHHIQIPEIYKSNEDNYEDEDCDEMGEYECDDNGLDYLDCDDLNDDLDDILDNIDDNVEYSEFMFSKLDNRDVEIDDCDVGFLFGKNVVDVETKETYLTKIRSLKQYNNNVYLSATIDEESDMMYYSKNIREMIEKGYLSDYVIKVPIFSNDPTNENVCKYLVERYRNLIIYCNSKKEGKNINDILNKLLSGCSEYIDCNTTRNKRNGIISKYKIGQIPFLVNVRILTEGFDAPITKGVVFLHLPKSDDTIIQIIGRALRLHPEKRYANIILPYSTDDDEKSICAFLKTIAKNDKRIRQSYEKKQLGGYIDVMNATDDENVDGCDAEFRFEQVYSSLGVLQYSVAEKIKLLFEFVELNGRTPTVKEKYNEIMLGKFYQHQKEKITSTNSYMYKKLAINNIIKDSLDLYLKNKNNNKCIKVLSNEEKYNLLFKYVNIKQNVPEAREEYNGIKLGTFYYQRKHKITSTESDIYKKLAINTIIRNHLNLYLEKKETNISNDEKYNLLLEFIEIKNRIPKAKEEYNKIKIGSYYDHRKGKIMSIDSDMYKLLSTNKIIKDDLDRYLETKKSKKKELSMQEKYDLLYQFANQYKRTPKSDEEYMDIKLGLFFTNRKTQITSPNSNIYKLLSKNKIIKVYLDIYLENKNIT